MKKRTNVLQVTVWPNHHVVYKVRIGKRMIKLLMRRFNRIKINRAVRYAGKNYVKYYVNYGRKRGVIYGKLLKITKRVHTNKSTYSKYY